MSSTKKNWPKLPLGIRLLIAAHSMSVDAFSRNDGSAVNRRLMNLFDPKASPSRKPDNGVVSSDIVVDTTRKLWFRLYSNTTTAGKMFVPIVVYFHGGGFAYMAANSMSYDDLCKRLAREIPAVVVSVNYRLSPEHRYPSHAGGNLAHHVALKACQHQFSRLKLRGVIALQPFFGGEERTESELKLAGAPLISVKRTDWMWKAFLPHGYNRDHQVVLILYKIGRENMWRD